MGHDCQHDTHMYLYIHMIVTYLTGRGTLLKMGQGWQLVAGSEDWLLQQRVEEEVQTLVEEMDVQRDAQDGWLEGAQEGVLVVAQMLQATTAAHWNWKNETEKK